MGHWLLPAHLPAKVPANWREGWRVGPLFIGAGGITISGNADVTRNGQGIWHCNPSAANGRRRWSARVGISAPRPPRDVAALPPDWLVNARRGRIAGR